MDTINSEDLRRKLRSTLDRVQFRGESLIVARHGVPAAKLVPIGSDVSVVDPTAATLAAGGPPEDVEKPPEKPRKNPKKTPRRW